MQEYERAVIFRLGRLVKVRLDASNNLLYDDGDDNCHHDHHQKYVDDQLQNHNNCIISQGGARGPGIFFIVPCIDSYKKVSKA